MDPDDDIFCVACNATLTKRTVEHHHFPIPKHAGGTATVPLCIVCHDHVHRLPIERWPAEWTLGAVAALWALPNRESKLLLMKVCSNSHPWAKLSRRELAEAKP